MKRKILFSFVITIFTICLIGCENSNNNNSFSETSSVANTTTTATHETTPIQTEDFSITSTENESSSENTSSYTVALENYFEAFNDKDAEAIFQACYPYELIESGKNSSDYTDEIVDITEYITNTHLEWMDTYESIISVSVSEYTSVTPLTDEQLANATSFIQEMSDMLDVDYKALITEGYMIEYTYEFNGTPTSEISKAVCFAVNIEGNEWKFISYNYGELGTMFNSGPPIAFDPQTGETSIADVPLVVN